jgi:pyruvate formate lyase activating enzyme
MMIISGFQKMTLLDYPGKVACTIFLGGCNFRCPFCHNASLVISIDSENVFTQDEIFAYLEKRKGILDGVCITGGEPLLNKDIVDFVRKIKSFDLLVKLDTNGSRPELLKTLTDENLIDYVAMDIKNSQEKYGFTVGCPDFDINPILESVKLLKSNVVDYEFRTTVVKELHEISDFEDIGKWIQGAKRYFLQKFVDSGDLIENGYTAHDNDTMKNIRDTVIPYVQSCELRGIDI